MVVVGVGSHVVPNEVGIDWNCSDECTLSIVRTEIIKLYLVHGSARRAEAVVVIGNRLDAIAIRPVRCRRVYGVVITVGRGRYPSIVIRGHCDVDAAVTTEITGCDTVSALPSVV